MRLGGWLTVGLLLGAALVSVDCSSSKPKAGLCLACAHDQDCSEGSCVQGLCQQSSYTGNVCPSPTVGLPPSCACGAGDAGVCFACSKDTDCAAGFYCDPVIDQCTRSCATDPCPAPSTCNAQHLCGCAPGQDGGVDAGSDGGRLFEGGECDLCYSNSDCGSGFLCDTQRNQCVSACGPNNSCPTPATCDGLVCSCTGVCAPCLGNSNCALGYVCDPQTSQCISPCGPNGACPAPAACHNGSCSCGSAVCTGCVIDAQCAPGFFCSPLTQECTQFCGANNPCPAPATCQDFGLASLCTCADGGVDAGPTPSYAENVIPPFMGSSSTNAAAVTPSGLYAGGLSGNVGTLVSLDPTTGNQAFTKLLALDGGTAQVSAMTPLPSGAGLFLGGATSGPSGVLYPAFFNFDSNGNLLWGVQDNGISGQVGGAWPLPGGQVLTAIQGNVLELFVPSASAPSQNQRLQLVGPGGGSAFISAIASGPLGTAILGTSQGNAAVSLYDTSLSTLQWQLLLTADGGSGTLGSAVVGSDGIYAAGSTNRFGAGRSDLWAIKLDPSGAILWQETLGTSTWDYGSSIALVGDAGVLVTGSASSLGLAALLDPQTGNLLNAQGYGSSNLIASVGVPNASGFFLFMSDNSGGAYYLSTDSNLRIPSCSNPSFAGVDAGIILSTSTATADPTQGITLVDAGMAALTNISPDVSSASSTVLQQCQ